MNLKLNFKFVVNLSKNVKNMKKIYYVIKDGHCLDKFDNEDDALSYAKHVGGKVTQYNNYNNYYDTTIF